MGAVAGPWGMAIGGLAGLAVGVKGLADGIAKAEIQEKGAEVKKELEQIGEALNKVTASGQKYLDSVNKMNEMFKNPAQANPEDLANLQRHMAESLTDIPDKFRTQFIQASGDAEKIKEVFGKITEDLQRTKNDLAVADKGFEMMEKYAGSATDDTLFDYGDSKADRARIDSAVRAQITGGGVRQDEVLKRINTGDLDIDSIQNFQDIDTSLLGDAFRKQVESMSDQDDIDNYTRRIKNYFITIKHIAITKHPIKNSNQ